MRKYILPITLIAIVIGLDQCLKFWVKAHMDNDYFFNPRKLPQQISVIGDWFQLHFVENNGMAFGLEFGGETGKIFLTIFRIAAVIFGLFYLYKIIKKNNHWGLITCVSLIIAGALGNIIDSVFYGVWFADINHYDGGYFHGQVVDMLYFPIIHTHSSSGEEFIFFSPIFNLADAAISVGVITLVLFQNIFFKKQKPQEEHGDTGNVEHNSETRLGEETERNTPDNGEVAAAT